MSSPHGSPRGALACPACGGALHRRQLRERWMRWLLPGSRRHRCSDCRSSFLRFAFWRWLQ